MSELVRAVIFGANGQARVLATMTAEGLTLIAGSAWRADIGWMRAPAGWARTQDVPPLDSFGLYAVDPQTHEIFVGDPA